MTSPQRRLTGRIRVGLPPGEAFRLFTPRGEQDWTHGWHPRFPAPASDDTQPGTVFETGAHGQHTIWLVLDRQWGKRISYAARSAAFSPEGEVFGVDIVTRHAPPPQVAADVLDHGHGAAYKRVHVGDRGLERGVDVGSGEVAMRTRIDGMHAHRLQAIAMRQ